MTVSTLTRPSSRAAVCLLCALLALLLWAARADANVGEEIVLRCTHGQSLKGFTQKDYSEALHVVANEAELEEYSPCGQLIHQAELEALGIPVGGEAGPGGAAGTPGAPGASAGSAVAALPVGPAEQRALERAQSLPPPPSDLGGQLVSPGVLHANVASAASALPTSLQVVLGFIVACAILAAALTIGRRVRARNGR